MNQHEILKEYLTALYRAEVVVSDNPSEPLYFNGADSLITASTCSTWSCPPSPA